MVVGASVVVVVGASVMVVIGASVVVVVGASDVQFSKFEFGKKSICLTEFIYNSFQVHVTA